MAKKLFLDAMDVDITDDRRQRRGVYHHFPLQAGPKVIDFIFLDIRYFAKEDGKENILGNEQWKWLESLFENGSSGDLVVIASGIQILPISRIKTSEGWHRFADSQKRLFSLINKFKIEKQKDILLISGDVHRGEIMKTVCKYEHESGVYFNEFLEVTSSGLTHSIGDDAPFIIRNFVRLLHWMDSDGITECLWRGINFGEIKIEWEGNYEKIKNVKIEILDNEMNTQCSHDMKPMVNSEKYWHQILQNDALATLMSTDKMICYGANRQYTVNEKYWNQKIFDISYKMIAVLPVIVLMVTMCQCIKCLCCKRKKEKIA